MSVLATQLRDIRRRPSKLFLTGAGILVAAFFAYAIVLAQQVTEGAVAQQVSETPAGAAAVIESESSLLPVSALDAAAKTSGVAAISGRVNGGGVRLGTGDAAQYFNVLADPGSGPLTRVSVKSGSYPDAPGEVAVSEKTVERDNLQLGQRLMITPENGTEQGGTPVPLTVTGVVGAPEDQGSLLVLGDRAAAALTGGTFSRIDVAGSSPAALVQALTDAMPKGDLAPKVRDAATVRDEEVRKRIKDIEPIFMLLSTFVVISVIAAALVVTSTFRIMFAQRMRQLALLRAVGAAKGRITRALIVEGGITGLVAGATGVGLALALGFAVPAVAGAFGRDLPAAGVSVGWAVGIVLGAIAVTVLAVLAPAVTASRVSPLQALRTSATTASQKGISRGRLVLGLLLVGTAALLGSAAQVKAGPLAEEDILVLFTLVASGTATFGALLALGPVIIRPVLRVVAWPLSKFGPVGQLAVGGVGGAPRRAAAVSAVVALGVTLISGVLIGSATIRAMADAELALQFPADIEARTSSETVPLPDGMVERLAKSPDLAEVLPYRQAFAQLGEQELPLVDLNLRELPSAKKFNVPAGSLSSIGPGVLALPEIQARALHTTVGQTLTLTVDGRTRDLRVGAVIDGGGPLGASAVLDPADLTALVPSAKVTGVLANAPSHDPDDVTKARAAVVAEAAGHPGIVIDTLADGQAEIDEMLNTLTAVALGMLALTIVIAVAGVGTTTALSVVERTRESGMLRAVGLSKRGLKVSITTEAALYGLVGSVIGLVIAVPYSALLLSAAGIEAAPELPFGQIAAMFAVLAGLTALAGLLPARQAARVSPVAALAQE